MQLSIQDGSSCPRIRHGLGADSCQLPFHYSRLQEGLTR